MNRQNWPPREVRLAEARRNRLRAERRAEKAVGAFFLFWLFVVLAFWAGVAFVVLHFLTKWW